MSKVVLIGDSHLTCLKRAAKADQTGRFADITFQPLGVGGVARTAFFAYDRAAQSVQITAPEWKNLTFSQQTFGAGAGKPLLAVSLPLNSSRVLRDYGWETHVPWHMQQDASEWALSDALVQTIFEQDSTYAIAFLQALKEIGLDVAVLESPRFFENAQYLQRKRFDVIQYVEATFRAYVRGQLDKIGVPVIAQPEGTLSAQGCTLLEYDHENPVDAHHANAEFGRLMLGEILGFVAAR